MDTKVKYIQVRDTKNLLSLDGRAFVSATYRLLLGREPDPGGLEFYLRQIESGVAKSSVLAQVSAGNEFKNKSRKVPGLRRQLLKHRLRTWLSRWASRTQAHRRAPTAGAALTTCASQTDLELRLTASVAAIERAVHELNLQAMFEDRLAKLFSSFDGAKYLAHNPDVAAAEINPYEHWIIAGRREQRTWGQVAPTETPFSNERFLPAPPTPGLTPAGKYRFDADWYLSVYPDVAAAGIGPLEHYQTCGKASGRLSSREELVDLLIDAEWYLRNYPDVGAAGQDPLEHYVNQGRVEGRLGARLALSLFDREWYLRTNPDVAAAGVDPLQHYLREGRAQGRPWSSFKPMNAIEAEPLVYSEPVTNPKAKLIAFYLPQFHPIPENDKWWGKGFTEWTNVSRARPFYEGHEQPRLPGELGFYDLRLVEVMRRQAELASAHGLYGFCFYVYWFGGRRLLESPVQMLLRHPEIAINFCYCWANENWTRRWDGLENDVLIGQSHSPEDDIAFIKNISPGFLDQRYIRVDGKPMLVIYRPTLFPDIAATVNRWREWCRGNGIGELHICFTESFDKGDPASMGLDASIEFPPSSLVREDITNQVNRSDDKFAGQVHNYLFTAKSSKSYRRPSWIQYRGVMPSWDNTPRKMERSISFYGATPELYAEWLDTAVSETCSSLPEGNRYVFINAWNEWGEGAYLEPDRRRGYAYLNRTREVMSKYSITVVNQEQLLARHRRANAVAVVIHLYYGDLLEHIAGYLDNFHGKVDLYFSVRDGCFPEMADKIAARYPDAIVVSYPNLGRDVLPFLHVLAKIIDFGYDAICKIHSKKSRHRNDGDQWRDDVLSKLLGDENRIAACISAIEAGAGIVAPEGHLLDGHNYWGANARRVTELAVRMGCPRDWVDSFSFPAGTMFWFKPEAVRPLLGLNLGPGDFEGEGGQLDGTTAHAVERLIGLSAKKSGLRVEETTSAGDGKVDADGDKYQFAARTDLVAPV